MTYPSGTYVAAADGHWYRGTSKASLWGPAPAEDPFVLRTTRPDASNTGVLPGTTLTTYTGPSIITTPNAVFTNIVFTAFMKVRAANVRFYNCKFVGPTTAPAGQSFLLWPQPDLGAVGVTAERCTFRPQKPSYYTNGMIGGGFALTRCDISGTVDAVDPVADNVTLEGCYVHDAAYFSPSPSNSDNQTHTDGIQIQGGVNHQFIGNTILGFADMSISVDALGMLPAGHQTNSAFMIKPDVSLITGLVIEDNWLDGGGYTINMAHDAPDRYLGTVGRMWRNKFGRLQSQQGPGGDQTYTISMPSAAVVDTGDGDVNANVYWDTNSEILVRHNG